MEIKSEKINQDHQHLCTMSVINIDFTLNGPLRMLHNMSLQINESIGLLLTEPINNETTDHTTSFKLYKNLKKCDNNKTLSTSYNIKLI